MQKTKQHFNVGDKVFAKVKGYPAWPAVIIGIQTKKYNVKFYGTGETAVVKAKDVFYYLQHKNNITKTLKRKDYNDAITQIEEAIKAAGGSDRSENNTENTEPSIPTNLNSGVDRGSKRKRESMTETKKHENKELENCLSDTQSTDFIKLENHAENIIIDNKETSENINENYEKVERMSIDENTNIEEISIVEKKINEKVEERAVEKNEIIKQKEIMTTEENKSNENEIEVSTQENKNNKTTNEIIKQSPLNNMKIIPKKHLETIIAYSRHVRKNPELYREIPVNYCEIKNGTVIATLPSGKLMGIKYNQDFLSIAKNEYERATLEELKAIKVLQLLHLLEQGITDIPKGIEVFEFCSVLNADMVKRIEELDVIEYKKTRLQFLKDEATFVELDWKIRGNLGLDKATPKVALKHLEAMYELEIKSLTLKKHSHVVDMIKKLQRYIGNVKEWNFDEKEREEFQNDAKNIRVIAGAIYQKFMNLFGAPNEECFQEIIIKSVKMFKKLTADLTDPEISVLSAEPYSRDAFLDKLYKEDGSNTISK